MSASQRDKFQMVKEKDIRRDLHSILLPQQLPEHLGGSSKTYTSKVNIEFDPRLSKFPIDSKKRLRDVEEIAQALIAKANMRATMDMQESIVDNEMSSETGSQESYINALQDL